MGKKKDQRNLNAKPKEEDEEKTMRQSCVVVEGDSSPRPRANKNINNSPEIKRYEGDDHKVPCKTFGNCHSKKENLVVGGKGGSDGVVSQPNFSPLSPNFSSPPPAIEVEDENGKSKQMSRRVFVSTLCALCKSFKMFEEGLKLCGGCRLVSYCSKDHQMKDWKDHKTFCSAAKKLLKKSQKTFLYQHAQPLESHQWLQARYEQMTKFECQLGRGLEPYEREILLFPNVCGECRGWTGLEICPNCRIASFCKTHFYIMKNHKWCSDLAVWTDLISWEHENGLLKPQLTNDDTKNWKLTSLPQTIGKFLTPPLQPLHFCGDEIWKAAVSDVASIPLTLLWAIKNHAPQLLLQKKLRINVVGAEMEFEGRCGKGWEFSFLHLLEGGILKRLEVTLIGPEMTTDARNFILCSTCSQKNCKIIISHERGITYHEYVKKNPALEVDVVAAFNCGLYRMTGWKGEDTWGPTIPYLGTGKLLVTTAYTESESGQDIQRLASNPRLRLCGGGGEKNPYRSLRPQRTLIDEENQPLMYKNHFIAVFKPS